MSAIKKMKDNKAPGLIGLTMDMIKALPEEAINFSTEVIQEYWMNPKCDFETWHVQNLVTLYKGKGDAKDLNNWRGICLKETTMKIVSSIIADRLLIQLKKSVQTCNLATWAVKKHYTN